MRPLKWEVGICGVTQDLKVNSFIIYLPVRTGLLAYVYRLLYYRIWIIK